MHVRLQGVHSRCALGVCEVVGISAERSNACEVHVRCTLGACEVHIRCMSGAH